MSTAADVRKTVCPLATALLAFGTGCTPAKEGGEGACEDGACEVATTKEELLASLEGFADPMAAFLRERADEAGGIAGGFGDILDGLGDVTGCAPDTERAFMVLSNQDLLPKAIVTRCVDDPVAASAFFMVMEPGEAGDDVDPERVRVAAWDPEAARYRRYQMLPRQRSGLAVAVEPAFCTGCHGGPFGLQEWTPIMNEMTNPWAQWNAEPGFRSFEFDEALDPGALGPVLQEVTAENRLDSASNLEPIVRAGIDRAANARLAARTDDPDLEVALSLLRPVFCDESVNFVSEIHDAGELNTNALVDPGLRGAMLSLADEAGWPWAWVTAPTLRIPAPSEADPTLAMIAVRGETTVQAEAALLSRQVLEAEQVLRVRALDFTHPVFSELRCGLWRDAAERARGGSIDVSAHTDNAALVRALYEEAMVLAVGGELVPLAAPTPGAIVAVADAHDPSASAALASGDLAALEVTPTELGEAIDAWVTEFEGGDARARLEAERHRRGCLARDAFVVTPLVPGLDECA